MKLVRYTLTLSSLAIGCSDAPDTQAPAEPAATREEGISPACNACYNYCDYQYSDCINNGVTPACLIMCQPMAAISGQAWIECMKTCTQIGQRDCGHQWENCYYYSCRRECMS